MPKLVLPLWFRNRQEEGWGPGQGQAAQGSICAAGSQTRVPGLLVPAQVTAQHFHGEHGMRPQLVQEKEGQQLGAPRLSLPWLHVPAGSGVRAWHCCSSALMFLTYPRKTMSMQGPQQHSDSQHLFEHFHVNISLWESPGDCSGRGS